MNTKKLSLDALEVLSFITTLDAKSRKTMKTGADDPRMDPTDPRICKSEADPNGCKVTHTTHTIAHTYKHTYTHPCIVGQSQNR